MKKIVCKILLFAILVSLPFVNSFKAEEKIDEKIIGVIEEKLGKVKYNVEYLKSFSGDNRYLLFEGNNCYLIYDLEVDNYVEYSDSNNSIYCGLPDNTVKIYYLPTYYFYEKDSIIYDVFYDRPLKENEVNAFLCAEKEMIDVYRIENKNLEKSRDNSATNYVPYDYYFKKLIENVGSNDRDNHPDSCEYVAIEMILSYYDTILNDDIIDEQYDVTETNDFDYYDWIDIDDYAQSPGIDDSFHDYMIGLGRVMGFTSNNSYTLGITNTPEFVGTYFYNRNINATVYEANTLYPNKTQFIKDAIDDGYPVLVGIGGIDLNVYLGIMNHAVVAYGYTDTDIRANYGWGDIANGGFLDTNINGYLFGYAAYFDIDEPHLHSDNYEWTVGGDTGCRGSFCPCGYFNAMHTSLGCIYVTTYQHIHLCTGCDYFYFEEHNYVQQGNQYVCTGCGNIVNTCPHNLSYNWFDYIQHRVVCSMCDLDYLEPHIVESIVLPPGQQYAECIICLGPATHGIIMKGKTKEIYQIKKTIEEQK